MKKVHGLVLFFCCAILFVLGGCQTQDSPTDVSNSESSNFEEYIDTQKSSESEKSTADPNVKLNFEMQVTTTFEDPSIFLNVERVSAFDGDVCTDHEPLKTLQMTILGVPYTLIYQSSGIYGKSGIHFHEYRLEGTEKGKVAIHADTGEIIKYTRVPYFANLTTESDYVDFIKNIAGEKYELDSYEYRTSTWYVSDTYENGVPYHRSREVNGFYICGENERVKSHSFNYIKTVGGIDTNELIETEFYVEDQVLSLVMFDIHYEENIFSNLLEHWEKFEFSLDEYIHAHLHPRVLSLNSMNAGHTLFVKGDQLYVLSVITVSIDMEGVSDFYTGAYIVTQVIETPD